MGICYILLTMHIDKFLNFELQVLDQKKRDHIRQLLDTVMKEVPLTGLGITEKERVMIIKAMGLSQGHWYKCPNGMFKMYPFT